MKEQGPRNESPRRQLTERYEAFYEAQRQGHEQVTRAVKLFRATNGSEKAAGTGDATGQLISKVEVHAVNRADAMWLAAMDRIPGITASMMLAIWDVKDKVTAEVDEMLKKSDTPAGTQPPQEELQDPLESMLKPGTPFQELNARYADLDGDRATASHRLLDAEETLRSTIPREETAQAADDAITAGQEVAEKVTDIWWIRAMDEHPFVGPATINEVWDIKKELRDREMRSEE